MGKNEITVRSGAAEYLTYVAAVGGQAQSVEMRYENENIWLTQKMMAELYGVDVRTVNEHIQNIFSDGELTPEATIRKFRIVQTEGKRQVSREVAHYNLQMIISVGFKVNNDRAVQFRKWAGQIVKDYTIQGWTMDAERLKKGHMFTDKYFERQLEPIREIRLSERKIPMNMEDWAKRLDGFLEFNGNEILTGHRAAWSIWSSYFQRVPESKWNGAEMAKNNSKTLQKSSAHSFGPGDRGFKSRHSDHAECPDRI